MRRLDINKILNKNGYKIISSEEALKDVEPFYTEEEIEQILKEKNKDK